MNWLQKILFKIEGKNKGYVSEADQFIQKFDQQHPQPSLSQQAEIRKHTNIFNRRRDTSI